MNSCRNCKYSHLFQHRNGGEQMVCSHPRIVKASQVMPGLVYFDAATCRSMESKCSPQGRWFTKEEK